MNLDEFCSERYMPKELQTAFARYLVSEYPQWPLEQLQALTGQQLQDHWRRFARTLSSPQKVWLIRCVKEGLIAYGRWMVRVPQGLTINVEILAGQGFLLYLYRCPKPTIVGWN